MHNSGPRPTGPGLNITPQDKSLGLASALGAFSLWGCLPVYWKQLIFIDPLLILLHRIVWSFVFLAAVLLKSGSLLSTLALLKNKRHALIIALRSLLLTVNWGLFIWAVNNNHLVESSLGYFLNPLLSTLIGVVFFHERPDFLQKFAVFLALTGVSIQIIMFGSVPVVALSLASIFAAYGAIRKKDTLPAVPGLFLETVLICPPAAAALVLFALTGEIGFERGLPTIFLIICSGPLTSIPLLLFAYSTLRLNLTTIGLAQYISPTLSLLLGVWVYGEAISRGHMVSFVFIWAALALYSFESLRLYKNATKLLRQPGQK
ncbi:MAG: EamA family transporter RarD [Deltaproteobacteria bacterium]|jgi:chloramphenicol-sensitive protein RarD|nr:EamA family transporter RarD [Deltaproteobacteria bacterium]